MANEWIGGPPEDVYRLYEERIAQLSSKIRAVADLHQQMSTAPLCNHCGRVWPCPTAQAASDG